MLFVGDDWAEDHHDVEIVDSDGKRLGRARLPEGMTGMTRLHALIAEHLDEADLDSDTGMLAAGRVVVGSKPTAVPGSPRCSWPAIRCSRSTRCRRPATANATPRRGRSPTRVMPMCSPRSYLSTANITARSLATRARWRV